MILTTLQHSDNQQNTPPHYLTEIDSAEVGSANYAPKSFAFIDLFCGIGAFHQAISNLGGKCVYACDIDAHCRKTYERNYGILPDGDITKVDVKDIPPHDVLCGGFPCQ